MVRDTAAGGPQPRDATEFIETGNLYPKREQRSEKRIVSVYRLAKLLTDREELCLIRNISSGGLKAEVFSPRTIGEELAIDFGNGLAQPATVQWSKDNCIGLAFVESLDVAHMLSNVPALGERRTRSPRLPLEVRAAISLSRERADCQLIDISQAGTKLRTNLVLESGDRIRLDVEGLGRISGLVRWIRDSYAGIAFVAPLSYRPLAAWVASAPQPTLQAELRPRPSREAHKAGRAG